MRYGYVGRGHIILDEFSEGGKRGLRVVEWYAGYRGMYTYDYKVNMMNR